MVAVAIQIPSDQIREFCRRHHIRKLSLFGSALRLTGPEAFRLNSDIDLLAEFAPGHTPGLAFIDMQDELSALLGKHQVDLVTEKFLHHRIRQSVLQSAVVLYEE